MIERGCEKGFYQGINFAKSYCENGHEFFEEDMVTEGVCPICGSKHIVTINRVCGYLGYSRTMDGGTRMNKAKLCEIAMRKNT